MTSLRRNAGRRGFLQGTAAALAAALLPASSRAESTLVSLSATEAVRRLRDGSLKAEHYTTALLDRCESLARLNAFITLDRDAALAAAVEADRRRATGRVPGPLHGLPLAVKDSISTMALATTGGTGALRNFRPARNSILVDRLLGAGATLLGKTNLHELSYGYTSNNFAFGPVTNPYAAGRVPGGSSGGSAAVVAARMAPLSLAADTGGSVRVPAALCGVAGLRPSLGLYPSEGTIGITPRMDTVGPHARTVEDLALFHSVAAVDGQAIQPQSLRGIRLGVPRRHFWEDLEPGVERVAAEALQRLRDAGAVLVEADLPDVGKLALAAFFPIVLRETEATVNDYLKSYGAGMTARELVARSSPWLQYVFREYIDAGGKFALPPEAYGAAVDQAMPRLKAVYAEYFTSHGVAATVFPAVPMTAPRIGEDAETTLNGRKVPTYLALSRNALPGSVACLPGLVLPAGLDEQSLPVGLEFDGQPGRDRDLLALGLSVENVLGMLPPPSL